MIQCCGKILFQDNL